MKLTSCNLETCQASGNRNGFTDHELCSGLQARWEESQGQLQATRAQLQQSQAKYQLSQSQLESSRALIAELRIERQADQRQIQQLEARLAELEKRGSHEAEGNPAEPILEEQLPRQSGPQNSPAIESETGENATEGSAAETAAAVGESELVAELRGRINELTEQVKECRRQLAQNSRNSSRPPSSDGFKKENSTANGRPRRDCEKKSSGGQPGHQGRTMRQTSQPDSVQELYPTVCPHCGEAIDETAEWHPEIQVRQLVDQEVPSRTIKTTEYRAHRCSCSHCGRLVRATFPAGVDGPVQFGPNLSAHVVYLRIKHLIPERRIVEILKVLSGVNMSSATVATVCRRQAEEVRPLAPALQRQAAQGEATKHLDGTGLRIEGKTQWLHVMSTEKTTSLRVAEGRGEMFDDLTGRVVHDSFASYPKMEALIHGYCHAHHLRELQAAKEQQEEWAGKMVWYLLVLERFVRRAKRRDSTHQNRGSPELAKDLRETIYQRYDDILNEAIQYHQELPPLPSGKRGRRRKRTGHNLAERLQRNREDSLRFVFDWAIPFTNNLAERDSRMMKLVMKISGCFRSQQGAADFAVLRGVISTAEKQGWDVISTLRLAPEELADKLLIG